MAETLRNVARIARPESLRPRSAARPGERDAGLAGEKGEALGDAKGAVFRKGTVVEHEDEMALFGAETNQGMPVPAREIPHVARFEVIDFRIAARTDHGGAHTALDHKGPLGGIGVPVQLA